MSPDGVQIITNLWLVYWWFCYVLALTSWLCDETCVCDELTVWRHDRVTRWPCDELTGSRCIDLKQLRRLMWVVVVAVRKTGWGTQVSLQGRLRRRWKARWRWCAVKPRLRRQEPLRDGRSQYIDALHSVVDTYITSVVTHSFLWPIILVHKCY